MLRIHWLPFVCRFLGSSVPSASHTCSVKGAHVMMGLSRFIRLWVVQIFINGEFVGGSDILMGMHQSGELQPLLDEAKQGQQQ